MAVDAVTLFTFALLFAAHAKYPAFTLFFLAWSAYLGYPVLTRFALLDGIALLGAAVYTCGASSGRRSRGGVGGWFGDPQGHSRASKLGWERRRSRYAFVD